MKWLTRMIGSLTAAIVLVVGLNTVAALWLGDEGNPLHLGRWMLLETRRTHALRHRSQLVAQSWHVKQALIEELVAGRLPLRQAIVQFKQANDLIENDDTDLVAPYSTPSDPESLAKQVLAWARNEVGGWPPHKDRRILTTLDAEFRKLFGRSYFEASGLCLQEPQSSGRAPAVVAD
jgi:hypothetical protein